MYSATIFLSAAALALTGTACGKPDAGTTDTAAASAGASAASRPSAQAVPAPTLTPAAAETANASPGATQSGSVQPARKSAPSGARITAAPADTGSSRPPAAVPARDTARDTRPTVAPPPPTPVAAAPAPVTTASVDSLGRPAYEANCRRCHGVRGVPPKTMQAKYPKIPTFDAAFVAKVSADSIATVLTRGVNDDMKSFRDKLTRDQMLAVAAYVRAFAR